MPVIERSIPALLRRHAQQQPDAPAFTFVDYELAPAGFTETLTWSQAYRRLRVVAAEVASRGTPGDRVAILAPQGLDYIVGFLAAMEAGRIAVPLSVPAFGTYDEQRFCRSPRGGSRSSPAIRDRSRRRRTSRSTWRRAARPTTTWPDSTWATCWALSAAANASTRRRSDGSPSGSPGSTFLKPPCCRPMASPKRRYMMWRRWHSGGPRRRCRFDYEKLSARHAKRCSTGGGVELVSYGAPRATTLRIVDPKTWVENPAGKVGEIWVHGDNVTTGYWRNRDTTEHTFGGRLVAPSPGTPPGPWLRTGDLGVIFDGELFIVGRIKDLLIVDGRNHYPDDIDATIQEITGGRAAAISVADDQSERLVTIAEVKKRNSSNEEMLHRLRTVKHEVTSAIETARAARGRSAAGAVRLYPDHYKRQDPALGVPERYQQGEFARLDASA